MNGRFFGGPKNMQDARKFFESVKSIELVSVPYWNWDKLGKDQAKKQEYLRNLLSVKSDNA